MMCPIHEVQVAVTGVSNACVKGAVEIIIMVAPPSLPPTRSPTIAPSEQGETPAPTAGPTTSAPTTALPTATPTSSDPTTSPTASPTVAPTLAPAVPPRVSPTAEEPYTGPTTMTTTTTAFLPTMLVCFPRDLDDCDGSGGQQCIVTETGPHCVCLNGFAGSDCTVPICDTEPCFNDGACRKNPLYQATGDLLDTAFSCTCAPGLVQPACGPPAPLFPDMAVEIASLALPGTLLLTAVATTPSNTGRVWFSLVQESWRDRRQYTSQIPPVEVDSLTGEIFLRRSFAGGTSLTLHMSGNFNITSGHFSRVSGCHPARAAYPAWYSTCLVLYAVCPS